MSEGVYSLPQELEARGIRMDAVVSIEVDDAVIERLKRFGVGTVELGAQSMIDEVLHASGRGHTTRIRKHLPERVPARQVRALRQDSAQRVGGRPGARRMGGVRKGETKTLWNEMRERPKSAGLSATRCKRPLWWRSRN